VAFDALELVRVWTFMGPTVGEGGLDEDPSHEAEGAGGAGFLGFDLERFPSEFAALLVTRNSGTGTCAPPPPEPVPEFRVVSTRQGESLTRRSSCPSMS
jgi:hypothetical protein